MSPLNASRCTEGRRMVPGLMRLLLRTAPLLLALCLVLTLARAGGQAARQLTITLERAPDTSQDTVTLKATVKNISRHDVLIGAGGPLIDYSLTVTDLRGVRVPLSKDGKEFFSKDRVRWSSAVIITLRPGEVDVDTWAIDKLFEFARPGRSLVTVRRDFVVAHESDSSNVLEVALN